ncbi:retrovirus-related pol polyprotein from transposon TNT 1-94 [Tanacetum coccineum]
MLTLPLQFCRLVLTLMEDPQCSSYPPNSINAVKTCSKEINHSQKDQPQMFMEIRTRQILAHAPMYNAILNKYVESLELGENGSVFIQGEMLKRMEDPRLFTLPCRLGDSKPFDALDDLGVCLNIILLYLFKKLNIGLLEETNHVFGLADGTKSYPVGIFRDVEVHIGRLKLLNKFYVIDMKKDPETPLLVGRGFIATVNAVIDYSKAKIVDKPPKNGDGAWHAKIRLIDPDGEEFTKTLQSVPTSRKLSKRESPREIINLDHFYDT